MTALRSKLLYSPEVLALASELSAYPLNDRAALRAEVRSPSCGSSLILGLGLNSEMEIAHIGVAARACAIGQASAAIFALAGLDKNLQDVEQAEAAIIQWLLGDGEMPKWPRFELISAAHAYPARHGAIILPWRAALVAFRMCDKRD
ncbi:MAG: hypothetical protein RLY97_436 [Pseudomonadota bacterium]|jgi:NifU-like protein involved in Fe-S cluster formation